MIEIRTFDGSPAEMASFLRDVLQTEGKGKFATMLCSRELLEWQFFNNPHVERDYILAAYDGGKMVGAFLAVDGRFRSAAHGFRGSLANWLTVAPEYRAHFVGPQLVAAMLERHATRGADLIIGVAYPTGTSTSLEFWEAFAQAWPNVVSIGPRIGYWARILDPRRMARASLSSLDRLGAIMAGVLFRPLRDEAMEAIRPARPSDAAACLDLFESATCHLQFTFEWDQSRLSHQLGYGSIAQTLVATVGERVVGWINFHQLELVERELFTIAMIDHFIVAPEHTAQFGAPLLRAALFRMQQDGLCAAVAMQLPLWPKWSFVRCGFVRRRLGHRMLAIRVNRQTPHTWTRRMFLPLS
jgi:predicted N-acetyltransferase YhbS